MSTTVDDLEWQRIVEELRRSRAQLAEAQALARIGSWEWDIPANRVTWSDELFRIYGMQPGEVEPSYEGFLERVHPDDRASVDARNHQAFADHQPFEDVKRIVRADGEQILMRTQGEVMCDAEGAPIRMIGVCEDVTDRVRAQEAQAMLAAIVDSSQDAIFSVAADGTVRSWNGGAQRLYGYVGAEAIGRPVDVLLPPGRDEVHDRLVARLGKADRIDHFETQRVRKDGEVVDVSLAISAIRGPRGQLEGLSCIARDITERKRFDARLRHLVEHDALTGLCSRARFEEELALHVAQAARYHHTGAILVLDVDNFKYVNDTYGHPVGDLALQAIAQLQRDQLRDTDVLGRIGGDAFAVLLPRADAVDAGAVAHDLLEAVRHEITLAGGHALRATVSIGGALFDGESTDADDLLSAADRAMYEAKASGRDRVVVHAATQQRAARAISRTSWEHRVRTALAEDLFTLDCQPILDLRTGETHQYEVLLRLADEAEPVRPAAFLNVAERFGLIKAIDRWVVREAIHLLSLHLPVHPQLRLEVNLSGRSMGDQELIELIEHELLACDVPPTALVFEITETAAIANMAEARRFADRLSQLGCSFALDDFGAGFGSFYYLNHLPAQYLKFDGEFVRSPRSRTDEMLIEAIVQVARALGKQTIAEFVTDADALATIKRLGVDFAQGHHTGMPFPVAELGARLR